MLPSVLELGLARLAGVGCVCLIVGGVDEPVIVDVGGEAETGSLLVVLCLLKKSVILH